MSNEEQNALALKLAREWQLVISTLTLDTIESAKTIETVVTKMPWDNFWSGKISLLSFLGEMAQTDVERFESESRILDELAAWRELADDLIKVLGAGYFFSDCNCNRCSVIARIQAIVRGWDEDKTTHS